MNIRSASIITGLCLVLSSLSLGATNQAIGSVFSRLDTTEATLEYLALELDRYRERIGRLDKTLQNETVELDIADRATRSVRQRVEGRLARWESSLRATDRLGWKQAGHASDSKILLLSGSDIALRDLHRDLGVLQKVDSRRRILPNLVAQIAAGKIGFAQHSGERSATEGVREQIINEARTQAPAGEVKTTAAKLATKISELEDKTASNFDFHRSKGTLVPPVTTQPTVGFGKRGSRTKGWTRHTGLSYPISESTPVRAVAAGRIVHAARFEGYGNLLIIDHGSGYHSVYAHLSEFLFHVGDRIDKKAIVAKSGATGSLDGPKLFFELRHRGRPIDPATWFRGGTQSRR
jgi:septal ring factor EnvC (AmiA/AmiB activator)